MKEKRVVIHTTDEGEPDILAEISKVELGGERNLSLRFEHRNRISGDWELLPGVPVDQDKAGELVEAIREVAGEEMRNEPSQDGS